MYLCIWWSHCNKIFNIINYVFARVAEMTGCMCCTNGTFVAEHSFITLTYTFTILVCFISLFLYSLLCVQCTYYCTCTSYLVDSLSLSLFLSLSLSLSLSAMLSSLHSPCFSDSSFVWLSISGVMKIDDFSHLFTGDKDFPLRWKREYLRLLTTFGVTYT